MSRIYISATRKSSGKTTFSLGLSGVLCKRGLSVQTFKKGPDYIDPLWLGKVTNRPCVNVDFNCMSREEIVTLFGRYQKDVDINVIEGNKGLFDGVDVEGTDSNAAMAGLLDVPVILVLDAQGITRGVAPLLMGYQDFDPKVKISGVVLNNVVGERHESKLRRVIDHYTNIEVLGAIQRCSDLVIEQRHLGLITQQEDTETDTRVLKITEAIERQVDVDRIIEISGTASSFPVYPIPPASVREDKLTIGVARDHAFCFYYPDDIEEMKRLGASIVYFDTINDNKLPAVDALFIGGGFPETHAQQLQQNHSMRADVQQFINTGKPVYAECGGLMYLTREINWQRRKYQMVGAIPADTDVQNRPVGRGYVKLKVTSDHPWIGSTVAQCSDSSLATINAHEFHYSKLLNIDPSVKFGFEVVRGHGVCGNYDGLIYGNIFASYSHMRNSRSNPWVSQFVETVRRNKAGLPATTAAIAG